MVFEILDRAFVFLRCCFAVERAKIFSFARPRIFLSGIQPILAGLQFPNHALSNIRRPTVLRAFECRATPKAFGVADQDPSEASALRRLDRTVRNPKGKQRTEDCEVCHEVRWEAPVLAGMTKATARDIQPANFRGNDAEREDHDQHTQNRKRATI